MEGDAECEIEMPVYKGFEEVVKTESNILKSDVDKPFLCHICSKRYQYKKSLNLHLKKYHGIQPVIPKNIKCLELGCDAEFSLKEELLNHLSSVHEIFIETSFYSFESWIEFNAWKEEVEKCTCTRFVFKSDWRKKDGSLHKIFNCNRSGSYKPLPGDKRKRKIKAVGYRKIGQCCPARLAATEEKLTDGTTRIRVEAILDHYGHEEELNHISFSKGEKSLLYGKILSGSTKQKILRDIRSDPASLDQQKLLLTKRKDLHNIQSAINKRAVATDFDYPAKKRKTDYRLKNTNNSRQQNFHNKNNITVCLPVNRSGLIKRSQVLEEDIQSSVICNELGSLEVIQEPQESLIKQSRVSVPCHTQPLPLELIIESNSKQPEEEVEVYLQDEKLQVEVVQDCSPPPSYNKLLREVAEMCVSLQGCLLTRDVHYTELEEIGRKLKLLVANCNSHSLRKNGYPLKILSSVTSQKEQEANSQTSHQQVYSNTSAHDVTDYNVRDVTITSDDVIVDDVDYYQGEEQSERDKRIEFILKYCTPAALQKYNKGILLSKHDLRLPANPQHIDVLNENFDKLLKVFDGEGQDSLFHYASHSRELWKCAVCGEVRKEELTLCRHCLRSFHPTCTLHPANFHKHLLCDECFISSS